MTRPDLTAKSSTTSGYQYPFFAKQLDGTTNMSSQGLVQALKGALSSGSKSQPEVVGVENEKFKGYATIFNGAVKTPALALVRPSNAEDVSRIVKFCRKHNLEVCVKAGGTGVHGWSVAGHVIIDLSSMTEISITKPCDAVTLQDSFAKLRLTPDNAQDGGDDVPRRPSLTPSQRTDSGASNKRSASDAVMENNNEPDNKRRMDTIEEDGSRSLSNSGVLDRSGNSSSSSSDRATPNGSGSSRSTAPTSEGDAQMYLKSPDGLTPMRPTASPMQHSDSSSSSSSSTQQIPTTSGPQPRVTYVNPTPTAATAYPFVPTSFGSGPSSSNSPYVPFQQSYTSQPNTVAFNTNPDPPEYTIVTFGAGVNSKQLDSTTSRSPFGAYHVPTSAFPVGAGQYLLGGFGFLGRKYGLAMDNVVEAEMVLSDGRIVWVGENGKHGGEWKESEDPEDVWWALRGAGPILGVVTRFRAKAYYVPSVYAGNLIYVFDPKTTPSLLRHVRDCIKGSPLTLYTNIIMTAGPPGSPAIVVIQLCCSGPRAEGDMYVQLLSAWEGGRCLFQDFSERSFERQQVAVEEVLKGGQGKKWFIKSDMLNSLDDHVIEETCKRFDVIPDGCTWLFEFTGGSVSAEVQDSCYPKSHREAAFTVAALHQWGHTEPPDLDERCVMTAEHWINEVINPNSPGGPLPCFLQSSTKEAVKATYGENFDRLARIKNMIDPINFFKHGPWPREGAPGQERQLGVGPEDQARMVDLADGDKGKQKENQINGVGAEEVDGAENGISTNIYNKLKEAGALKGKGPNGVDEVNMDGANGVKNGERAKQTEEVDGMDGIDGPNGQQL